MTSTNVTLYNAPSLASISEYSTLRASCERRDAHEKLWYTLVHLMDLLLHVSVFSYKYQPPYAPFTSWQLITLTHFIGFRYFYCYRNDRGVSHVAWTQIVVLYGFPLIYVSFHLSVKMKLCNVILMLIEFSVSYAATIILTIMQMRVYEERTQVKQKRNPDRTSPE